MASSDSPAPTASATGGAESPAAPIPIELGYAALRISVPVFVALQQGLFEKHGLEIRKLHRFETAQPLIDALVAGHLDVAGYAALPISFGAQARSGVRLLYLTEMLEDAEHPFSYLIVAADSPWQSLHDLAGKRVGILPTLAYRVWLQEILEREGVRGVVLQDIAPGLQGQALATGQVDALWTNDPAGTAILRNGTGRLLVEGALVPKYFGDRFLFGSFNVRADYAAENPEVVRRLASALDEAIAFTMAHPSEAREAMAEYVPQEQRPYARYYPDSLYRPTGDTDPARFREMARRYGEMGILPGPLDLTGLVYVPHRP